MDGVGPGAPGGTARADFGTFFAERQRELGLLAHRLSGDRAVAEEITADAFAEAWRRWDELSGSDSPTAALHEIVARLAEGRIRRAVPTDPQDPYEPDAARIRALTNERIALIPQQNTTTIALGGAGVDADARHLSSGFGRFRRPGPIGIVIAANAVAAAVAVVVVMTTVGSSGQGGHVIASLTETNTVEGADSDSPNQAEAATGFSPSPSHAQSASASPSPTADQSTDPASASAATVTTAASAAASPSVAASPSAATTTATTSSAKLLTASGTVNSGSNASWTQLDVATDMNQSLSAMTITIRVAHCTGLLAAESWDDGAGGQFTEATTTNADGSVTYTFTLASGDEAGPGDVTFAAQFSHATTGWTASADTYSVTTESASSGATENLGGGF